MKKLEFETIQQKLNNLNQVSLPPIQIQEFIKFIKNINKSIKQQKLLIQRYEQNYQAKSVDWVEKKQYQNAIEKIEKKRIKQNQIHIDKKLERVQEDQLNARIKR